ncbi:esterase-like activity of phytase family protein [Spongiactinospora rosea]|uniref:Esterase-like activity of phytase family protein n=1 Tax=Spongiactinospora rosea TaxID=2248750 RepID=A0A366LM70_9ACTN|nr:esterase-like activity of phytase family protein [Spongiactinospora rosea]RBQ14981.1 esterase-like activity of phytase family protein [Spongiactinospora rosea]
MFRPVLAGLALAAVTLAVPSPAAAEPGPARRPVVTKDVRIPPVPLAELQRSITDDRGVELGGIGSGLFPAARRGDYWMVTDRGPNGQVKVDGDKRRTFPIPEFAPAIVQVATRFGVEIKKYLPLVGDSGKPITGLSNQAGHDEEPYTWDARTTLPYNPSGVDTEDIVRGPRGDFWLVDEYGPSLLHVSERGKVLARYVPKGLKLTGADYPVKETLPAILASRQQNRGFEGLAIGGGTLYLAVQSPLANPDKKTAKSSRNGRILTYDIRAERVTGEYAYRFEDVTTFDPKADGEQDEMKISGLAHVSGRKLLVDERTDNVARIYQIDLAKATNLLGGRYDDPATAPSLEAQATPQDVRFPAKALVADLPEVVPTLPGKVEGIALLDRRTLVVANDNDFGVGEFGADGRLVSSGVPSRIVTIRLPRPLR